MAKPYMPTPCRRCGGAKRPPKYLRVGSFGTQAEAEAAYLKAVMDLRLTRCEGATTAATGDAGNGQSSRL